MALDGVLASTVSGSRPSAVRGDGGWRLGDFFRYHGLWALGVRLFRAIGFRAKALTIATTFAIPLAWLSWSYFTTKAEQIGFSAKERVGVTYARAAMPLLAALEQHLQTAQQAAISGSTLPGDRAGTLSSALNQLGKTQQALGQDLGTDKAWTTLQSAMNAATAPATPADAVKADGVAIQALLELIGTSTDGSNLTLDPDIDSYYLMDASMVQLPALIQTAGQLTVESRQALASADADAPRTRQVIEQLAALNSRIATLAADIDKAVAYNASVTDAINRTPAEAAVKALTGGTESSLLGSGGARLDDTVLATRNAQAVDALVALTTQATGQLDALLAARVDRIQEARNWTAIVLVASLLAALYLFMAFGKVLDGGLNEVAFHINAMRDGDLTTRPRAWGADEPARLMHTLAEMQAALRRIVSQVREASDSIVSASTQIAGGAQDLSVRTEKSASNLRETAAAMEEVAATVKRNEQSMMTAAELAQHNSEEAERGGRIIGDVVATMQAINESSGRIGDIIGTIDGIAFQTNILALNAAVEAARAGEQGRGFAVVASEVRALAQRSSEAAREIKELIGTSVEQVEDGVRVVRKAGEAIGDLQSSAEHMRALLAEVSAGAHEQSVGVTQSAHAVQEMDGVTQQNAALVEEAAAAAGSLNEQARGLAREVSQFRLPASV